MANQQLRMVSHLRQRHIYLMHMRYFTKVKFCDIVKALRDYAFISTPYFYLHLPFILAATH